MRIPANLTEEEVLSVIEKVVGKISAKYKFGIYDLDDIRQEARILCMTALAQYDGERPLENFLSIHVRNRLITLRRDKHVRYVPPCKSCPLYNKALPSKCEEYGSRSECDLFKKFEEKLECREKFINPIDIHVVEGQIEGDVEGGHWRGELLGMIKEHLPAQYINDFHRFLEGAKLGQSRQAALLGAIGAIIEEFDCGDE